MGRQRHDLTGVVTERRKARKLRFVRVVIVTSSGVLVVPLIASTVFDVLVGPPERLWLSLALVAAAAVASVQLLLLLFGRVRLGRPRRPSPWLYWGSSALVWAVAVSALLPFSGMMMLAGWVSVAIFNGPRRWGWWLLAVNTALCMVLTVRVAQVLPAEGVALLWAGLVAVTLFLVWAVLIYVRLWDVTNEALLEQRARARLAVSEERLRFSRDMHDLLGHSLSALAAKSEVAERVLEQDPARAAREMVEVQSLARRSLHGVRTAVRGYREIDLAEEAEAVRTALAANGIRTEVSAPPEGPVPSATAALAAWVVREGGTNVLRHSDASECRITFSRARPEGPGPDALVVEVANDRSRGRSHAVGGGLEELTERLAAVGGTLTARPTRDHGFLLRAVVPRTAEGPDRTPGREEER